MYAFCNEVSIHSSVGYEHVYVRVVWRRPSRKIHGWSMSTQGRKVR
jgi:hypothetical protein